MLQSCVTELAESLVLLILVLLCVVYLGLMKSQTTTPKLVSKSLQNNSRMTPKKGPISLLEATWRVLELSCRLLERSGNLVRALGGLLRRSEELLEPSWSRFL